MATPTQIQNRINALQARVDTLSAKIAAAGDVERDANPELLKRKEVLEFIIELLTELKSIREKIGA